jgi:hypothetical protein
VLFNTWSYQRILGQPQGALRDWLGDTVQVGMERVDGANP